MLILEIFKPVNEMAEQMSDIVSARELIGHSHNNPDKRHEYLKFLKHLREKYGTKYSTLIHQEASRLAKHKEHN